MREGLCEKGRDRISEKEISILIWPIFVKNSFIKRSSFLKIRLVLYCSFKIGFAYLVEAGCVPDCSEQVVLKLPEKNIEVQKIFEKYQPLKKGKVNKKCQAISQLLRNKLPLSIFLKCGQKYKDGKQFNLLCSLEHFLCTV